MRLVTLGLLSFLQVLICHNANAGAVIVPPQPKTISALDFGYYIKPRQNGNRVDFDLDPESSGYKVKKDNSETLIFSESPSKDGVNRDEFYSKIDGNKQTAVKLSGHTYDIKSKPSRGAYVGNVWQFDDGKMLNQTTCVDIDYASFKALNISSSHTRYCITLTPKGCQSLLKEAAELESMKADVKACAKLNDKILKLSKYVEPDGIHEKNVSLMNERSKGKAALIGFQSAQSTGETLMNEFRTLDAAKVKCDELMHLWVAQGQVAEAPKPSGDAKNVLGNN